MHATEEKTLSIADTETTINETTYTKGIKTNGSSSTTSGKEYRVIEFTTTGAGTVKIAAKSGSADDATRTITILNKGKVLQKIQKQFLLTQQFLNLLFIVQVHS